MIEHDPQTIHSDENKPVPTMFTVTQARVEHYGDVVEHMVNNEVARCKADGFNPSQKQIEFLRKEIVRYAVIRRDVEGAQQLKIRKGGNVLNEANARISARIKL